MHAPDPIHETIRQLETSLTDSYVRRAPERLAELLADDFREFGSSGRRFDKREIIRTLQSQPQLEIELADFAVDLPAPGFALATYRAVVRLPDSGRVARSWRSSCWRKQGNRWQIFFHQGTPIPEAANGGSTA